MTNAEGTNLDPKKLNGNLSYTTGRTTLVHFKQGKPFDTAWGAFRGYLRKWTNKQGKLHRPLGKWILPVSKQRQKWPMYISPHKDCLYSTSKDIQIIPYNTIYKDYRNLTSIASIPEDASPIDIHQYQQTWRKNTNHNHIYATTR